METKLKTLKDLEEEYGEWVGKAWFPKDALKEEAIKWIKHIEVMKKPQSRTGEPFNTSKWKREEFKTQILWIKHFFNLTEEDLK